MSGLRLEMDEGFLAGHAGSRHVGMPKERMVLSGMKVVSRREVQDEYGTKVVLGFEDQGGNVYCWVTDTEGRYVVGEVADVRVTVKAHEVWDGVKVTVVYFVSRVVADEKPKWSARALGLRRR